MCVKFPLYSSVCESICGWGRVGAEKINGGEQTSVSLFPAVVLGMPVGVFSSPFPVCNRFTGLPGWVLFDDDLVHKGEGFTAGA